MVSIKKIISLAKATQIALQKMIPRKEIKSYVEKWNPWDQLAQLKGKRSGKNRSSSHPKQKGKKEWDQITSLAQKWKKFYNN